MDTIHFALEIVVPKGDFCSNYTYLAKEGEYTDCILPQFWPQELDEEGRPLKDELCKDLSKTSIKVSVQLDTQECINRAAMFYNEVLPQMKHLTLQNYENMNLLGILLRNLRTNNKDTFVIL